MPDFHKLEGTIPVAPLSLIVMESAKELGNSAVEIRTFVSTSIFMQITFRLLIP